MPRSLLLFYPYDGHHASRKGEIFVVGILSLFCCLSAFSRKCVATTHLRDGAPSAPRPSSEYDAEHHSFSPPSILLWAALFLFPDSSAIRCKWPVCSSVDIANVPCHQKDFLYDSKLSLSPLLRASIATLRAIMPTL